MIVLYIFAILFIGTPFLPATEHPHWFFRTADFVRLQSIAIEVILLALLLFFGNFNGWFEWALLIGLCLAILYQAVKVFKYSSLYPRKKPNFPSNGMISLLAANVLQTNDKYEKFLDVVAKHDPDIVVTMESDLKWENGLKSLEKTYPHTLKAPNDEFYGMHVYSKKAFIEPKLKYQVEAHVPSMFIDFKINEDTDVHFCFLHPAPPSPTENETSKERDAELMITGKRIREKKQPTVVCGDMNDVVWSRTTRLFKKMTSMIDPRIGRGFFSTYYAQYWFMRFPLDHLFHTKDLYIGKMERTINFGSDHYGMYYEIHHIKNTPPKTKGSIDKDEKREINTIINAAI